MALEELAGYFASREGQRREQVAATLDRMTPREQRIAREAAVMGYALGGMGGGHHGKIPPDADILHEVITGCLANADLYPVVAGPS